MKVAMVSEHASPLAVLGGVDAGGQNVHVASLGTALADQGVDVVIHTRRDDARLRRRVPLAPGVVVDHVPGGPPRVLPKDELLPHMSEFAADLRRSWEVDRPDVVHAHFWMSGWLRWMRPPLSTSRWSRRSMPSARSSAGTSAPRTPAPVLASAPRP